MKEILKWIDANRAWIFDGVGVLLISAFIGLIVKLWNKEKKSDNNQTQTGGDDSVNIQAGRDIRITHQKEGSNARQKDSKKR